MEPRTSKRDGKLLLAYELPHRLHCAQPYPILAPNGSTILLYGHERGLRILWRGGRRPKDNVTKRPNGAPKAADVIVIDGSDDESHPNSTAPFEGAEFEDDEDEVDPDSPYPPIIQDLDLDLGFSAHCLATATLPSTATRTPQLLRTNAVVALAGLDGSCVVLSIPLKPPSHSAKRQLLHTVLTSRIDLHGRQTVPRSLSVKTVLAHGDGAVGTDDADHLLVATCAETLQTFRLSIAPDRILYEPVHQPHYIPLPFLAHHVSFHPSPRAMQILVADTAGAARIYDLAPLPAPTSRPVSRDSPVVQPFSTIHGGKWITAFLTSFISDPSAVARRKQILDAKWVFGGRAILALLEDGEWGIWDFSGSLRGGRNIVDFVLHGFLGSSLSSEAVQPAQSKKPTSKLAPMTPNTRKAKAEILFTGAPKVAGVAPYGGIFVALTSSSRTAQQDEAVLMHYGTDLYSIPSLQSLWQRSSTGTTTGPYQATSIIHITDMDSTLR